MTRDELLGLARGRFDPVSAARLRDHVGGCDSCTARLERIDAGEPARSVGRYVLLAEVGRGGMGRVYRAFDPQLERTVAVKLLPTTDRSAESNQGLLAEARLMAKLTHPNLVTVYDSGEDEGVVFIAMEYVTGQNLGEWLRKPQSLQDVVRAFREAGHGLLAAHRAGLVHRDFKPANVMMQRGVAKVGDFGLATLVTRAQGEIAGTDYYMAPEQLRGEADARSDQYAFGRSLAEALEVQRKVHRRKVEAGWLEKIIERTTAKDPQARFPSMVQVLQALEHDPAARRRRLLSRSAVVLSLGLAVVAVLAARWQTRASCSGGDERMAATWTTAARQATEAQLATALQPDAVRAQLEAMDAWAASWRQLKERVCLATRVRGEQSDELFSLKTLCLDRQFAHFATVVGRPGDVEASTLLAAIAELPRVADCDDGEALIAAQGGESPEERAAAAPIREQLEHSVALYSLGQDVAADAVVTEALRMARATSVKAVLPEVLYLSGQSLLAKGETKEARAQLEEAFNLAAAARQDSVAASIATELLPL
ncbi:MAG: serine/threonine-protein kinase [Myxococcota bacterium]